MNQATVKKESKNKIKVDFDNKISDRRRFWMKIFSKRFLLDVVWYIIRLILLIGIAFVVLYPFFTKISSSFMSSADFTDVTVKMIPRYPTLATYSAVIIENRYLEALLNTFLLSLLCGLVQMAICATVGYGFAKFKFKGRNILFLFVILTMIIPHDTLQLSIFMKFRYFDVFGIYGFVNAIIDGSIAKAGIFSWIKGVLEGYKPVASIQLNNTFIPLAILSVTGLAFKNGLYIFLMRQFFKGVPDELEEAAYIDGSGMFRTYIQIILPISIPMLITIFLFSFAWQWTDTFYSQMFFNKQTLYTLPDIVTIPESFNTGFAMQGAMSSAIYNTCAILIIAPLLIVYSFFQRYLIQGIERSGIVG